MPYNPNVPGANDQISATQAPIQSNFANIASLVAVNHVGFGTGNEGKHNFLQMPEQGSAPATATNEAALYSKEGAINLMAELFFRRENNGAEINFTEFGADAKGWARLPSGVLIKWGVDVTNGTSTNQTFNFPTLNTGGTKAIPAFTQTPWIVLVICTDFARSFGWLEASSDALTYTLASQNGSEVKNFRFVAIGI